MDDDTGFELSSALSDVPVDDVETSTAISVQETTQIAIRSTKVASRNKKRAAEEVVAEEKAVKRTKRGPQVTYEEQEQQEEIQVVQGTPKKRGRSRRAKVDTTAAVDTTVLVEVEEEVNGITNGVIKKPKKKSKAKVTAEESVKVEEQTAEDGTVIKKVKRKRKTKEEKEAEAMPLAARTVGSKILIGAHVSGAGGVHNAVTNAVHIGGNAFALFLKSQRKWANPPLQEEHTTLFKSNCTTHSFDSASHVVPHGSYLVNLAHTDPARSTQAYDAFLDDLNRCRALGIRLYNFHPGNCAGAATRDDAIRHLAGQLNKAHKDKGSGNVVTLLETMAAGGNVLGSSFEDLRSIIDLIELKDRVGVCLDTCHVFAAGYDLRTPTTFKQTIDTLDQVVGLKYLKALHLNDSKAPFASNRDLHANIGTGFLGLRAFRNLVNEPRLWGLPMVLETPIDVPNAEGKDVPDKRIWAREIKLLESLVGMDVEGEEFKRLEAELAKQGEAEREKYQAQFLKKQEKAKQKEAKAGKKKGRRKVESDEESSSLSSPASSSSSSSSEEDV